MGEYQTLIHTLALTMGVAWASGINLYAAVAVLIDSSEDGALLVAERVRQSLRSSPIGDSITVSAGIACYPTHALDAAELVSRAGGALEVARASGYDHDHVAIAASEA